MKKSLNELRAARKRQRTRSITEPRTLFWLNKFKSERPSGTFSGPMNKWTASALMEYNKWKKIAGAPVKTEGDE